MSIEKLQSTSWNLFLAEATHHFNCSKHSITNFSPFFLNFFRIPHHSFDDFYVCDDKVGNEDKEDDEKIVINDPMIKKIKCAWNAAANRIRNRQLLEAKKSNVKSNFLLFISGDLVML